MTIRELRSASCYPLGIRGGVFVLGYWDALRAVFERSCDSVRLCNPLCLLGLWLGLKYFHFLETFYRQWGWGTLCSSQLNDSTPHHTHTPHHHTRRCKLLEITRPRF